MTTKERQAYKQGKKEARQTMLAMLVWTGIIIAFLIKAGIFVI